MILVELWTLLEHLQSLNEHLWYADLPRIYMLPSSLFRLQVFSRNVCAWWMEASSFDQLINLLPLWALRRPQTPLHEMSLQQMLPTRGEAPMPRFAVVAMLLYMELGP